MILGITDFAGFCLAVLMFLVLPGPGTFALLTSTAQGGFVAGAAATLGLILGDQVLLWLAVAGVASLLAAYPMAFHVVQYAGAGYLAWVGLQLLLSRAGVAQPHRFHIKPRHHVRQAFLITLLNPKAVVFYMAFFPLFVDPAWHVGFLTFAAMAITIAVLTAVYCLTLCALADRTAIRVKAHKRLSLWLRRLAGLFLIAFGMRLIRP